MTPPRSLSPAGWPAPRPLPTRPRCRPSWPAGRPPPACSTWPWPPSTHPSARCWPPPKRGSCGSPSAPSRSPTPCSPGWPRAVSPRNLAAPARLDDPRRQLDEYFTHRRRRFELRVDLQVARGFRARVLKVARGIGYGTTATYRQVAASAGNPAAVRAAGSALGANPVPIVVPCHRVLRSDGGLGGYAGGLPAKAQLLALEREPG